MCDVFDEFEARGVKKGIEKGIEKGKVEILVDMVYDGDIPLALGRQRASKCGVDAPTFNDLMTKSHPDFHFPS